MRCYERPITGEELTKVLAFLALIDVQDPTDAQIHDVACGFHSGFPKCCIAYYIKCYKPIADLYIDRNEIYMEKSNSFDDYVTDKEIEMLHTDLLIWAAREKVGYFRCPACILSNNCVEVKRCPEYS